MIQTRQNRKGNWWCNATIDGFDHSFEGWSIEAAREQMRALLRSRGYEPDRMEWALPVDYQGSDRPQRKPISFKIDNNPQG